MIRNEYINLKEVSEYVRLFSGSFWSLRISFAYEAINKLKRMYFNHLSPNAKAEYLRGKVYPIE